MLWKYFQVKGKRELNVEAKELNANDAETCKQGFCDFGSLLIAIKNRMIDYATDIQTDN